MRFALVVAFLALAGCTCSKSSARDAGVVAQRPAPGSGDPPALLREPLFDDIPDSALNEAHALLFSRPRSVGVAPCSLVDGGCLGLSVAELHRAPFVSLRVQEGGDEPLAFIGGEVDFLVGRAEKIQQVLGALTPAAAAAPLARALFQHDLWERFDALEEAKTPERDALREPLAQAIQKLALPRAELEAIASNFDEVGRAYPELLPGWGGPDWVEVRAEFTERPGDTNWRRTTRHAERWGFRTAFRVLARVPQEAGGADWLRTRLSRDTELPKGTILALVGTPLVLSKEGEVVPLPIIHLVELRRSRGGSPAANLGELEVDVLEGKRQRLRASPRPGGGLVHLGPETPVPVGASCMPDRSSREPLKGSCAMCHGNGATKIMGPLAHGELRFYEEKDSRAAALEVARVKSASLELAALRALWR